MGNDANRRARKVKEASKRKQRSKVASLSFAPQRGSHENDLLHEMAIASTEHKSISRIISVPFTDAAALGELHDGMVAKGCRMLLFDIDDGGHKSDSGNIGGETTFYVGSEGERLVTVAMKFLSQPIGEDDSLRMLGAWFHELGHVVDFTNGINVKDGQPLDVVESEAFAHRYAIRLLLERRYYAAACIWMFILETDLSVCGVPNVETAARRAIDSREGQHFKSVLGEAYRIFRSNNLRERRAGDRHFTTT